MVKCSALYNHVQHCRGGIAAAIQGIIVKINIDRCFRIKVSAHTWSDRTKSIQTAWMSLDRCKGGQHQYGCGVGGSGGGDGCGGTDGESRWAIRTLGLLVMMIFGDDKWEMRGYAMIILIVGAS
jgi:hypothetical protein